MSGGKKGQTTIDIQQTTNICETPEDLKKMGLTKDPMPFKRHWKERGDRPTQTPGYIQLDKLQVVHMFLPFQDFTRFAKGTSIPP